MDLFNFNLMTRYPSWVKEIDGQLIITKTFFERGCLKTNSWIAFSYILIQLSWIACTECFITPDLTFTVNGKRICTFVRWDKFTGNVLLLQLNRNSCPSRWLFPWLCCFTYLLVLYQRSKGKTKDIWISHDHQTHWDCVRIQIWPWIVKETIYSDWNYVVSFQRSAITSSCLLALDWHHLTW